MAEPWENEDGSTNVQGFLNAYDEDDNTFWRAEQGHIRNVLDELIDRDADTWLALAKANAELDLLRQIVERDRPVIEAAEALDAAYYRWGVCGQNDYVRHIHAVQEAVRARRPVPS